MAAAPLNLQDYAAPAKAGRLAQACIAAPSVDSAKYLDKLDDLDLRLAAFEASVALFMLNRAEAALRIVELDAKPGDATHAKESR